MWTEIKLKASFFFLSNINDILSEYALALIYFSMLSFAEIKSY